MTRRVTEYTATQGRDKGKIFKLTEMDCAKAEELALRVTFLLERSGIELPPEVQGTGVLAVAAAGYKAFFQHCSYEDVKPILDEMWKCVQIVPPNGNRELAREPMPSDIEEVSTRLMLRKEVFKLHVDFSTGDEDSTSTSSQGTTPSPPQKSKIISTSRARSAQSSVLDERP